MPLPYTSPYVLLTTDLLSGDTTGVPLSGSTAVDNRPHKEIQSNVNYVWNSFTQAHNEDGSHNFAKTVTQISNTDFGINNINYKVNPVGNTAIQYNALGSFAYSQGNYNFTNFITGLQVAAWHQGSGVLSNAYGLTSSILNSYTGTITNAIGLNVGGASNSGGGSITNLYGLYIASQNVGTYNFAIYTNAGYNFFGDRVGIGITAPQANCHIKAGNSSVPPVIIDNGTLLSAPIANSIENNGTDLFYTSATEVGQRRIVHSHSGVLPTAITVGASPFNYQNANSFDTSVIISGGTISLIEFSRDNINWFTIGGTVGGMFNLSPSDRIRVTYSVVPTMTLVPR